MKQWQKLHCRGCGGLSVCESQLVLIVVAVWASGYAGLIQESCGFHHTPSFLEGKFKQTFRKSQNHVQPFRVLFSDSEEWKPNRPKPFHFV